MVTREFVQESSNNTETIEYYGITMEYTNNLRQIRLLFLTDPDFFHKQLCTAQRQAQVTPKPDPS